MRVTGNEEKPVTSWEDNRAMAGQALRIHNAQYRNAQAVQEKRATKRKEK